MVLPFRTILGVTLLCSAGWGSSFNIVAGLQAYNGTSGLDNGSTWVFSDDLLAPLKTGCKNIGVSGITCSSEGGSSNQRAPIVVLSNAVQPLTSAYTTSLGANGLILTDTTGYTSATANTFDLPSNTVVLMPAVSTSHSAGGAATVTWTPPSGGTGYYSLSGFWEAEQTSNVEADTLEILVQDSNGNTVDTIWDSSHKLTDSNLSLTNLGNAGSFVHLTAGQRLFFRVSPDLTFFNALLAANPSLDTSSNFARVVGSPAGLSLAITEQPAPEPATCGLLVVGGGLLYLLRRRKA